MIRFFASILLIYVVSFSTVAQERYIPEEKDIISASQEDITLSETEEVDLVESAERKDIEELTTVELLESISVSPEVMSTFKKLAKDKASDLRADLSLSQEQEEQLMVKIVKYSLVANYILNLEIPRDKKNRKLYSLASEQQEEMRSIMTSDQFQFYRRRNGAISSSTR